MSYEQECADVGRRADEEVAALREENQRLRDLLDEGGGPIPVWDVHKAHEDLVSQAYGYAQSTGVNGGTGGEVKVVRNWSDLRNFIRGHDPTIILFDESLDGEILQASPSYKQRYHYTVGRNKTLWGRAPNGRLIDITIPVDAQSEGFSWHNSQNIIFSNIRGTSTRNGVWTEVQAGAETIWFNRCNLDACGINSRAVNVSITHGRVVGADLAHFIDVERTTLSDMEYVSCGEIVDGPHSSVHINNSSLDWDNVNKVACRTGRRLYLTNNVFELERGESGVAIITEGSASWAGSGNEFNGASHPPARGRVLLPYPVQ